MDYRGKMITLTDGLKYATLEQTEYNGKIYVLANEIVDGDLGENITLFRVDIVNGEPNFVVETDFSVAEEVLKKLSE